MRTFSRNMPAARADQPLGPLGWVVIAAISLGLLALAGLVWWPMLLILPAVFGVPMLIDWRSDKREAERRSGESICGFSRSFDRRAIDPWIIRAVYEEFSYLYPVRSGDSLQDDLKIDIEDLEISVQDIAERIGRSLDNAEANPMWDKVVTVGDLVLFLQGQPKLAANTARPSSLSL